MLFGIAITHSYVTYPGPHFFSVSALLPVCVRPMDVLHHPHFKRLVLLSELGRRDTFK